MMEGSEYMLENDGGGFMYDFFFFFLSTAGFFGMD